MEKQAFITNNEPLDIALNFEKLRSKGIHYIEQLAGEFWTDYNPHDPGITILEQLCFAMTELAYRTEFDIKDLLKADAHHPQAKPLLLKPQQIFPCNALTVEDYRKLIFDSIKTIKNVWLIPLPMEEHSLNGIYKILFDVDNSINTEKEREDVIRQVTNVFYENRNMGEDVEEVLILEQMEIVIGAEVETDGTRPLEQMLAEIFNKIHEYLNPELQFYNIEELLAKGKTLHEIYTGPLLKHGFIPNEELKPKPTRILVSEITKMMMDVKGVQNVKNLTITCEGRIEANEVFIPENKLPKLVPKVKTSNGEFVIKFVRGNIQYRTIDEEKVLRILHEMHSMSHRLYRLSEETKEAPKGRYLALEDYYSVQNHFPSIYGIGKEGVPYGADNERRSMAKQLKGYMLLYEQLLTNYLAQLANAKSLFSMNQKLTNTYFAQSLAHIHGVEPLLRNEPDKSFLMDSIGYPQVPAVYEKAIHQITAVFDNYFDRRNRFLDWLLSLNGEVFLEYPPSQFNYYFSDEEFQEHLIIQKIQFLELLPTINANRSRAFNYRKSRKEKGNMNGLEAKISLLLGFHIFDGEYQQIVEMSLIEPYAKWGYTLRGGEDEELLHEWFKEADISNLNLNDEIVRKHFDFVDEKDRLKIDKNQEKRLLERTVSIRKQILPATLLISGIHLSRFRIGSHPEKDDATFVLFWDEGRSKWWNIGSYDDVTEASTAVMVLIEHLKEINITCEGLHLIEHILLRPSRESQSFGFYLLDEEGNHFLATDQVTDFFQRRKNMEIVEKELKNYSCYAVEITKEKNFIIVFTTTDGTVRLSSVRSYLSVQEIHDKMEKLFNYLSDKEEIISFEKKVLRYVKLKNQKDRIPEYFFTFRMSIALPNWTARFSNPEFRSIVEETIYKHHPAHISANCYWLSPQEMEILESTYYGWMDAKTNEDKDLERLKEHLTWILYRLFCGEKII
ncbi:MAG: hypothetical protein OHK0057_27490 [Thermoflexibacter sp.]